MTHPPGTVGICVQETGRYTAFTESLAGLETPDGSGILFQYGTDIPNGMSQLAQKMDGEWLFIMGDDHCFHPDLLMRLLDHNVDVVVPLCLMRQRPFAPVVRVDDEGHVIDLTRAATSGLVKIHSAGSAGMLIRKHVLDAVREEFPGYPVFERRAEMSEDFLFCKRVRECGFEIHCDLGQTLGHMTATAIWPGKGPDGKWCQNFVVADSFLIQLAIPESE
jgi:hypothetical protein